MTTRLVSDQVLLEAERVLTAAILHSAREPFIVDSSHMPAIQSAWSNG